MRFFVKTLLLVIALMVGFVPKINAATGGEITNCLVHTVQPCMYEELGPQKDLCDLVFDGTGSNSCSQGGCGASYNTLNCGPTKKG